VNVRGTYRPLYRCSGQAMTDQSFILDIMWQASMILGREEGKNEVPVRRELTVHIHLVNDVRHSSVSRAKLSDQIPEHSTTFFPALHFNPTLSIPFLRLAQGKV